MYTAKLPNTVQGLDPPISGLPIKYHEYTASAASGPIVATVLSKTIAPRPDIAGCLSATHEKRHGPRKDGRPHYAARDGNGVERQLRETIINVFA